MKIQYDKEADAMYIYLSKKKIARTLCVNSNVNVDVDMKGAIIGIEILSVSFQFSKKSLEESIKSGIPVFA